MPKLLTLYPQHWTPQPLDVQPCILLTPLSLTVLTPEPKVLYLNTQAHNPWTQSSIPKHLSPQSDILKSRLNSSPS